MVGGGKALEISCILGNQFRIPLSVVSRMLLTCIKTPRKKDASGASAVLRGQDALHDGASARL